jgi:hypothetical protein
VFWRKRPYIYLSEDHADSIIFSEGGESRVVRKVDFFIFQNPELKYKKEFLESGIQVWTPFIWQRTVSTRSF